MNIKSVLFRGVLIALCAVGILLCVAPAVYAQDLAIPRFVSFRRSDVNLRTGPGNRYPIKFVYRMKNYPVEVIDEYELWRQIREVDGTVGWVHRRMLSSGRFAVVTEDTTLRRHADSSTSPVAFVQKGALGKLEECQVDSCRLSFSFNGKNYEGWLNKEDFYGAYSRETFR